VAVLATVVIVATGLFSHVNARFYDVPGLRAGLGSHSYYLVQYLGEPNNREQLPSSSDYFTIYNYEYDNITFRMVNQRATSMYLIGESYRLGESRLRVGSTRRQVERTLARPNMSQLAQNFWIASSESLITLTQDKVATIQFHFDEMDIVQKITISWWG